MDTQLPGSRPGRDRLLLLLALLVLAWYLLRTGAQVVHGDPANDFRNYYIAAQDLAAGRDPYTQALRCCRGVVQSDGYNYPPLLAEMVRPISRLPFSAATRVWRLLNQLLLGGAIFVTWRTLRGHLSGGSMLVLFSLTLTFRPLLLAIDLGQVSVMLSLLIAAGAHSYARRHRPAVAGVFIAIAAVIKVFPAVIVLAFARWEKRPRWTAGMTTFWGSTILIVGVLWFLTPFTPEFFTRVLVGFRQVPEIYGNQSLPAVSLRWQRVFLGGSQPLGGILTSVLMVVLVGLTWWRGARLEGYVGRLAVFASLLAVSPLVSSITWDHHLVTEILAIALVSPSLEFRGRGWWLVVAAYPLLWFPAFPWILTLGALHAPEAVIVLLGGSLPALGALLLWLGCLACMRTRGTAAT